MRGNCAADQRLCFPRIDITITILPKTEISSPVCVGPGRKSQRQVFSRHNSSYFDKSGKELGWLCVSIKRK